MLTKVCAQAPPHASQELSQLGEIRARFLGSLIHCWPHCPPPYITHCLCQSGGFVSSLTSSSQTLLYIPITCGRFTKYQKTFSEISRVLETYSGIIVPLLQFPSLQACTQLQEGRWEGSSVASVIANLLNHPISSHISGIKHECQACLLICHELAHYSGIVTFVPRVTKEVGEAIKRSDTELLFTFLS